VAVAVVRAEGVLDTVVNGKAVLINPAGTQVVDLNALGSLVWAGIDGQREASDLVTLVQESLKATAEVPRAQIAADVAAFLAELIRLELVLV
jgi:hypothetical protein